MNDAVVAAALDERAGHLVKVALGDQHPDSVVVDAEEVLEVGVVAGVAGVVLSGAGKRDAVPAGEGEPVLAPDGSLEVQMELR